MIKFVSLEGKLAEALSSNYANLSFRSFPKRSLKQRNNVSFQGYWVNALRRTCQDTWRSHSWLYLKPTLGVALLLEYSFAMFVLSQQTPIKLTYQTSTHFYLSCDWVNLSVALVNIHPPNSTAILNNESLFVCFFRVKTSIRSVTDESTQEVP